MKHFHDARISATPTPSRADLPKKRFHGDAADLHGRMRTRNGKTQRRRGEAEGFRVTLMRLRRELGWSQEKLASTLGVTARTLSNWENGYWLPPVKQRLHVLLSLRDMPPPYVLAFADHLGLSTDPAHDAFLQPFRDAVYGAEEEPVAPPARLPVHPKQLKSAVDAAVREVAAELGAKPSDVRAGVARVIAACARLGATIEEAHEAIAR
jgi:transcriptional regulator with XRE-family HTH domain